MKKKYILVIAALFLVGIGYAATHRKNDENVGASHLAPSTAPDLVGSSSNLVSIPRDTSFANNTTTQADNTFAAGVQNGYLDGGFVLQQLISTGGQDAVILNISARGGTGTSTLSIRQQLSYDGTNWSDIHASSTIPFPTNYATNTPILLSPAGLTFDPGTVTTTPMSFMFKTYGAKFTRFLYMADDLLTDPNDGVQAWIERLSIEPVMR